MSASRSLWAMLEISYLRPMKALNRSEGREGRPANIAFLPLFRPLPVTDFFSSLRMPHIIRSLERSIGSGFYKKKYPS